MRFPLVSRFSGWVACCLCMLIPVLVGCGDYCLFCDGQGGGGGGNGNDGEEICDNVFSGLADYQAALNIKTIHTFTEDRNGNDRLSIAVVPKGMSFDYGSNLTAEPGYVLVADQLNDSIYIFDEPDQDQTVLLTGFEGVSGLALLHQEKTDETFADLLFFTVADDNQLYVHDLAGSGAPSPITNQDVSDVFTEPGNFFEFPTAIAVSADTDEVVVFVLNDNETDSSVRRLYLTLDSRDPISAKTIGTKTVLSRPLMDIACFEGTDALFVSKKTKNEDFSGGWVYRITDASDRTSSMNLDSDSNFIQGPGLYTGLTAAFTNPQGTTADLLVLREGDGSVEQYNALGQGAWQAEFSLGADVLFPQAVAYDCTNERLLVTNIPFDLEDNRRRLLEAFPTQ